MWFYSSRAYAGDSYYYCYQHDRYGCYRQQLINFQVDKTALQMQQWMEGAAAYYVQNNKWPASSSTSCTINQLLEGDTSACGLVANITYVTTGSIDQNPWQQSYTLIAPPSLAVGVFTVATNVPISLANRVAARLPDASVLCEKSTCSVVATITAPSQGSGGFNVIYASDQLTDGSAIPYPGTTSAVPACPANTQGQLNVSIAQFYSPTGSQGNTMAPVYVQSTYTTDKKQWTVHLLSYYDKTHQSTAVRIFAFVRCVPSSSLPAQNNSVSSNNFIY